MCHRIISINFFGKKDSSNTISKVELYILWVMLNKKHFCFVVFAAAHNRDVLSNSLQRFSLSHLPTTFGLEIEVSKDDYSEPSERKEYFDLPASKRMLNMEETEDGELTIFDEEFKPPVLPSRSSRCTRPSSSATPDPQDENNLTATLARMEATLGSAEGPTRLL